MNMYSILRVMSTPISIGIVILILAVNKKDKGLSYRDILPLFISLTVIIISSIFIMNNILKF